MADQKIEEIKKILLGDELKRFDTKFMEFGDELKKLSAEKSTSGGTDVDNLKDKFAKLQNDVKTGFEKIVDTMNDQFKAVNTEIEKNAKDIALIRKKLDAFKQIFNG